MEIDRRHVLLTPGLAALALSGCCKEERPKNKEIRVSRASFDRAWNLGDAPWDRIDEAINAPSTNVTFAPRYITVLHLELQFTPKLLLTGRRAHFEVEKAEHVELSHIQSRVRAVINYLNTGIDRPNYLYQKNDKSGLKGFGFRKGQHHFIIYIKNNGIEYNRDAPIWFGLYRANSLREASPNRTFYEAEVFSDKDITSGPPLFIYAKNYFRTATEDVNDWMKPTNRRPIAGDNIVYSMNINASVQTTDSPTLSIPLIFDPDTGNMGTGGGGQYGAGPDD